MISLAVILFASISQPASAFKTNQNATVVIGQANFDSNTCNTFLAAPPTQSGLCVQFGSPAFDSSGNLWVSDYFNNRILEFTAPFSNGQSASLVIGQSSFTINTCSTAPSGLCRPSGLAFDPSGNLWVVDTFNSRILEFTPPFSNGEGASKVIGQSNLTNNACTTTPSGLCAPSALAFDPSGNLWVVDTDNVRVLEFASPLSTGESASLVIGQSSFTITRGCTLSGPSGFCLPLSLALDSLGNLWVSDSHNNRVLEFKPPFSNSENASMVVGQPDFNTTDCHTTGEAGIINSPTQSGLCNQKGIAFDSLGNLWVSDDFNSRVLEFTPPFSNGEAASLVIGQSSFTTGSCNLKRDGLCGPFGVAFDPSGNLWVGDSGNHRVLGFRTERGKL